MICDTVKLFGVPFSAISLNSAIALLTDLASSEPIENASIVVTPNVDHLVMIEKNASVKDIYMTADYFFADGAPIVAASRLLGKPIPERVTGSDLMPLLLKEANEKSLKVFIVGGYPGEEVYILQKLKERYINVQFMVYSPPMGFSYLSPSSDDLVNEINVFKPNIIYLCIGTPKQEIWALKNKNKLRANVVLCVGAALEFILGKSKRAPKWIQKYGFEWLWRLSSNPARLWRRYLIQDTYFIILLVREFFSWRKKI